MGPSPHSNRGEDVEMNSREPSRFVASLVVVVGLLGGLLTVGAGAVPVAATPAGPTPATLATAPFLWEAKSPATPPTPRFGAAMAFDGTTSQVVLFGGFFGQNALGDTWTWDGVNWTQQHPTTSPPARSYASMAYDANNHQLVLFGGSTTADTWTWDGSNWTQLSPATSPPARDNASFAYDGAKLLLFGGSSGTGVVNDTWSWTGTTWTQLSPSTSPPARDGASMAFDGAHQKLVLFGGQTNATPNELGDTWTWSGTTWVAASPATSPSARNGASMDYDPATSQLVLFGGFVGVGQGIEAGDTWGWNGTTWVAQSPATSPSARDSASMAADPLTKQLVLFGGSGFGGLRNDTWTTTLPATAAKEARPLIFRNGSWYLRNSSTTGSADETFAFGSPGDIPVAGDWLGTGTITPGVVRNGIWYLRYTNTPGVADKSFAFGNPGDIPVTGHWGGPGTMTTPGVFRNGTWYLRNANTTGAADETFAFGSPGDHPITGDWLGTGTVTPGVFRNGLWYLRNSNNSGIADTTFAFAGPGDIPVTGDLDGNGTTTPGVVRNGMWYLRNSNTGGVADASFAFGSPGDIPRTWHSG
jgi:hypothetical protein